MNFFTYGEAEINYLKSKDKLLGQAIDKIGPIQREVHRDLFSSLISSIVGQQISSKAAATIWGRIVAALNTVTPETILNCPIDTLQQCGISFKKASYIRNIAQSVQNGSFNIQALHHKSDDAVCKELVQLNGVGVWTAEMLMLFSMQRPNILSFGDLAILRGMRMLYHHRSINKPLFEKYRRRYSPYGSVASLYLWAIAGGAIEGMKDYAPAKK